MGPTLQQLDDAQRRGIDRLGRKALALEGLLAISREIACLDLATALERILRHVLELTGARRGFVMLRDGAGTLRFEAAVNLDPRQVGLPELDLSRSVAEQALATGEVVRVDDVAGSGFRERESVVRLGLEALLAIPLVSREGPLGVLYADTDARGHRMGELDLEILEAFGSQAALALANARSHEELRQENTLLQQARDGVLRCGDLLYVSRAMHRVAHLVRRVAPTGLTALIQGETGVGKELVARAIHDLSPRRGRRFLAQNVGALPETLLESELFGHRRGAFSGAVESRAGLFEAADGGTVFLDEIGEAPSALQVRLLRFLETGELRRVGETSERRADVRIVAATHRDLEAEVEAGRFRRDLFYRLSVFPIPVPPLRQRPEDVPVLARHFAAELRRELGEAAAEPAPLSKAVLEELAGRPWKGNVRELRNAVSRLLVLGGSTGTPEAPHITPSEEPQAEEPPEPGAVATLEEVERRHILRVLHQTGGNQSQAARLLGLKRGTFRGRLKKLGIR